MLIYYKYSFIDREINITKNKIENNNPILDDYNILFGNVL